MLHQCHQIPFFFFFFVNKFKIALMVKKRSFLKKKKNEPRKKGGASHSTQIFLKKKFENETRSNESVTSKVGNAQSYNSIATTHFWNHWWQIICVDLNSLIFSKHFTTLFHTYMYIFFFKLINV
ncbi:hypothetical protein RFI_25011, partial [Reticulomyxa filosa]